MHRHRNNRKSITHQPLLNIALRFVGFLKYGENPRTEAELYERRGIDHPLSWRQWKTNGKFGRKVKEAADISAIAFTDLQAALRTAIQIRAAFELNFKNSPCVAVGVKHGNACGAGVGDTPEQALKRMIEGNPSGLFGALVIATFPIGEVEARLLSRYKFPAGKRIIAGVAAPHVDTAAYDVLKRTSRPFLTFENAELATLNRAHLPVIPSRKSLDILDLEIIENPDPYVLDFTDNRIRIRGPADNLGTYYRDIALADAVCRTSRSNTITIAADGAIWANAVGGQDRVGACQEALRQYCAPLRGRAGAVAVSDSFFPFIDGIDALHRGGIYKIFATTGSERDEAVAARVEKLGITLITLPDKVARGFFGH
ncbi:hypothetical protein H0X32_03650 [Patescibacteria group bacterium]|nr:hypothetical protein [Patescibacteria group bacterium]